MLVATRRSLLTLQEMLRNYYHEQLKLRLSPYLMATSANALNLQIQKRDMIPVFESLRLYMMLFDHSQLVPHELINNSLPLLSQSAGLNSNLPNNLRNA